MRSRASSPASLRSSAVASGSASVRPLTSASSSDGVGADGKLVEPRLELIRQPSIEGVRRAQRRRGESEPVGRVAGARRAACSSPWASSNSKCSSSRPRSMRVRLGQAAAADGVGEAVQRPTAPAHQLRQERRASCARGRILRGPEVVGDRRQSDLRRLGVLHRVGHHPGAEAVEQRVASTVRAEVRFVDHRHVVDRVVVPVQRRPQGTPREGDRLGGRDRRRADRPPTSRTDRR